MDDVTLPAWLEELESGSLAIKFDDMRHVPVIDGTEVKLLEMREPTVQDELSVQKQHKHPGDAETRLIANLTEQAPEAILGLKKRQYARLQDALAFFQTG